MGDVRFMQPPFAWGECATFSVVYKIYCNTAVGSRDLSDPGKGVNTANGDTKSIRFYVSGNATFIRIPEIHLETGFNGATYHISDAASGSYCCESTPRISLIPQLDSMTETNKKLFSAVCTPPIAYGDPTYIRYSTSGYAHILPEYPAYSSCVPIMNEAYGKTYSIPVEVTIANGGIINIYAKTGAFYAMKGDQSTYNGEFFGIDTVTFMYVNGEYCSESIKNENDINIVKDTNMAYKTFINKLHVAATKYDEIPITESNYATRLPFPEERYYPTDDNLNLLPGHAYLKKRGYITYTMPDKASASGNGADPNEDNSKMTTEE